MGRPRRLTVALVALLALGAAQSAPNDPHFPQQWGLQKVNAPEAWTMSRGRSVIVAVIDSGVDLEHPDLQGAFATRSDGSLAGRDLVDDDADPSDEHGHGTMVAGVVAARTANGIGVASVAPLSRIMPIRVLDAEAVGNTADVDAAIRWAVNNGAHVINLSLEIARDEGGVEVPRELRQQAPDDAVRYAWERGVVVVAAAGNDSAGFTDYRDDTPVLLIGATDREDRHAAFSDTGRRDMLMAPGTEIVSTWCNPCGAGAQHSIGQSEGTSYAAPHVSGALALLISAGVGPRDAVRLLRETAVDLGAPGPDDRFGHGRIDLVAALRAAGARAPRPEEEPTSPQDVDADDPPDHEAAGQDTGPAAEPSPDDPATVVPPTDDVEDAPSPEGSARPLEPSPTPDHDDGEPPLAAGRSDDGGQRGPVVLASALLLTAIASFALAWRSGVIRRRAR